MANPWVVRIGMVLFVVLVLDAALRETPLGETRYRDEEVVAAFLLMTFLVLSKYV